MKRMLPTLLALWVSATFCQAQPAEHNVHAIGASIRTSAAVEGDFMGVGARVLVDRPVADDATLAGAYVGVRAPVGGNLRAAGGDVSVESSVGGDLWAAGAHLDVTRSARVAGHADLVAGEVLLDGEVDGSLTVRARRLSLNGIVQGSALANVEELELGPQARVGGSLRHTSEALIRDSGAVVSGAVEHDDRRFGADARWGNGGRWPMRAENGPMRDGWMWMSLSMALLGVLVLATLLLLVFSNFSSQAARQIERTPWRALMLGAGVLVALPLLSMLFFFTVLGIPLGLLVMASYPPLLLLGWLIGALSAARWLAHRRMSAEAEDSDIPYGWTAVAVVGLFVACAIPVLGPLLMAATVAMGLGACVLEWRRRLATPAAALP